jgi:hypothetical protein
MLSGILAIFGPLAFPDQKFKIRSLTPLFSG